MQAHNSILVGLIIIISLLHAEADDSQCTINGRKAAHVVDERFISVSLDPAFLFSGIKVSSVAANLAKNLAPAFIRFAGPSTPFLRFGDDSKAITRITQGSKSLVFGPTMWWSLNAWIKHANLTPVFALNDNEGNWNPKSSLNVLDLTAKLEVECYWQLGYDCEGKSEDRYIQDLKSLRNVLDGFPSMKHQWKIVGSDLASCFGSSSSEISRKFMEDLDGVDAVMWEPETEIFGEDPMNRFLSYYQPTTPVWTSAPKVEHPITFKDGLHWGIHLGETARNGFDVIFRQPRFQELFSDTPVYWVSLLHKRLMGRNVLDVKTSSLSTSDTYIYAHCSKNQNSYSIRGAMTIMIINNGSTEHTTAMKVAGSQLKNVDVRSYILTSGKINSVDTYLNGEKLSINNLTDVESLSPKLRRAKAITHLTLTVPSKSIGFFVLPGARIPICISDEDETNLILEEIHRDQNIDFADIFSGELLSRINSKKDANSLSDLYRMIEKELEQDEKFYRKIKKTPFINSADLRRAFTETAMQQKHLLEDAKPVGVKNILDDSKLFINEASMKKLLDKTKGMMKVDFKNLLSPVESEKKSDDKVKSKADMDLSSAEILRLLADRAKAKMERKVGLANTDFDDLFEKTFGNKIRSKREARGGGHGRGRSGNGGKNKQKQKRDINMSLLDEKSGKKSFFRGLQKEATIRRPGESSAEYLENAFAPVKTETLPTKIFAGLASQEDEILAPPGLPMKSIKDTAFPSLSISGLPSLQPKKELFGLEINKLGLPGLFGSKPVPTTSKPVKSMRTFIGYVKEDDDDLKDADLDNLGDELDTYHGFHEIFGDDITIAKPRQLKGNRELWEFADIVSDKDHPGDLIQTEFIINNADTKGDIDKTIQRLENFFNNPADKTNQDFESTLSRFKRELPKREFDNTDSTKSRLHRRYRAEKLHKRRNKYIDSLHGGKPLKAKGGLDVKKYERQIKFLKSRLAHRKKLEAQGFSKRLHAGDLQRKLKERFGKANRRVRSAKNTYDIRYDEVYIPKVSMAQIKAFLPKLEEQNDLKERNPTDESARPDGKEIPVSENSLREINKRLPRHVNGDINSAENTIDEFLNAIRKDGKFIKPLSDEESGEYAIILPTRDSIALEHKNGDVKLKIHEEGVDSYTCPATDFTSSPNVISINDKPSVPSLSSDNDFSVIDLRLNSTGLQENSTSSLSNSKDYEFSMNKIVTSVNHLAKDVFNKIKSIFI